MRYIVEVNYLHSWSEVVYRGKDYEAAWLAFQEFNGNLETSESVTLTAIA